MRKRSVKNQRRRFLIISLSVLLICFLSWIFIFTPRFSDRVREGWKAFTHEGKKLLGWEKEVIPPEEKRIREEVIYRKMEEARALQDWRTLAPEYPRRPPIDSPTAEEKMKVLKNSSEFKEMDKELKDYLKRKEDVYIPDAPIPPLQGATDFISIKDKGTEKVIERLQGMLDGSTQQKPLEENLRLGMKGPLASRRILERPTPPQVKVKVEVEIELMLWVLPNGAVHRVVPSVKGDTELEKIAIQYLKQWRFAPLPKDQPQAEQWGTLPIKFRLQ